MDWKKSAPPTTSCRNAGSNSVVTNSRAATRNSNSNIRDIHRGKVGGNKTEQGRQFLVNRTILIIESRSSHADNLLLGSSWILRVLNVAIAVLTLLLPGLPDHTF